MPNWCFNNLRCIAIEEDDNILFKFHTDNLEDEYLNEDDFQADINDDIIHYQFNSRWSPPCNRANNDWLKNKSKEYPNIKFEIDWIEPGVDWWGEEHYINGEIVYNSYDSLGDSYSEYIMRDTDGNTAYNSIDLNSLYPNGFIEDDIEEADEGVIFDYLTEENNWNFGDEEELIIEHIIEQIQDKMYNMLSSVYIMQSFLVLTKYKMNKYRKEVKCVLSNKLPIELADISTNFL